jgi:hypothetical protein
MSTPSKMEAGDSAGPLLSGMARWLSLAAAPVFAVMAVLSASEPAAEMICSMSGMQMQGASVFSGMVHIGPWLKWMGGEGGFRRP